MNQRIVQITEIHNTRQSRLFVDPCGIHFDTMIRKDLSRMSDSFQTNYKSASNIVKNINSIFATIKENTNLSETQKQLGRIKQYYEQAQEALRIMKNTASTMTYNNKIQAMGFVRDIEQSLATIKKEISRWEAKLNKASLMGPVTVFLTVDL